MSSAPTKPFAAWDKFFERHLEVRDPLLGSTLPASSSMPVHGVDEQKKDAVKNPASPLAAASRQLKPPLPPAARHESYLGHSGTSPRGQSPTSPLSVGQQPKPRRAKSARNLRSAFRASGSLFLGGASNLGGLRASKPITEVEYEQTIKRLCKLILVEGVPGDEYTLPKGHGVPARALIWKLLLDVRTLDPAEYLSLVAKGPSCMHDKICNDTFRTLATDGDYKERVDEEALVRLLNAFVWKHSEDKDCIVPTRGMKIDPVKMDMDDADGPLRFGYVQGMNVLAAPFLYAMPSELEAYHCFCAFIETRCPTYVQPTLVGVHRGMELLDRCLQMADPPLASHLRATNLNAELYAFASVLTLCACTPPLKQLLQVWDFLLAFGSHLCVPCVVAQLLLMREDLLATSQPMKLLRSLPNLEASNIIGLATTIVRDLDEAFYDELVRHATEL